MNMFVCVLLNQDLSTESGLWGVFGSLGADLNPLLPRVCPYVSICMCVRVWMCVFVCVYGSPQHYNSINSKLHVYMK